MKFATIFGAAALAAIAATSPSFAQERFRPAGTVTFTPAPAAEQIGTYEIPRDQSRITALRFRIEEGTTDIRSFRVRYRDGESERFSIRDTFESGERTEIFELEEDRPVRSIEIAYTPRGRVKIALLVEGRRAIPEEPEPEPVPESWVELACNDVNFLSDTDNVSISPARAFRAIRLRAFTFDVQVGNIGVRYNDGTSERLTLNTIVPAGARTNAIELRSRGQRVARFDFNYGSTGFGTRSARMCIDGLRAAP